jgi:hypothetical protein
MMWVDIGVTVLLTLRILLFRPAIPQLLNPNNDACLSEGKDEQQERLFRCDGEVNAHSPRKFSSRKSGSSQLHIYVMPDSKVRR